MKQYREPKTKPNQIKLQRERDNNMRIFHGADIRKNDDALSLIIRAFCNVRITWDNKISEPLEDELESLGYDLNTLRFSIEKK